MSELNVELRGLLGEALDANRRGRLSHFIADAHSPAIRLFAPEHRQHNHEGDWYGEHAGKWLVAAARAAARSGDGQLRASVMSVTAFLLSVQEPDGYLGTYASERRFMQPQPPKPGTWDGAPGARTWDVWTHSYLLLGLLEVHRHFPEAGALQAARRIGDLCSRTFVQGGVDITDLGNHHGLSATVLLDAALELHRTTDEPRYLALAETVLAQARSHRQSDFPGAALAGADASEIATGKAYQLLWNLVGLAKLQQATGNPAYLAALRALWSNIRTHHLSLGGGPFGGVGHRSREVFNPAGIFSPMAYVETCSTLAWIQLNRQLLAITGDAAHAEEIERAAYNDLLGAQAADGQDWCYYSHPNGRRVHTTYWRCCKSSGAMALEELPLAAYGLSAPGDLTVNLLGPGTARFTHVDAGQVTLTQSGSYPYGGDVLFHVEVERAARWVLKIRIPAWAEDASITINDGAPSASAAGAYDSLDRTWSAGDTVRLRLPMSPRLHRTTYANVQESRAPDGVVVQQEVLHFDFVAIARGPLVYSTGLIDGFKTEETLRLPTGPQEAWLHDLPPSADSPAFPRVQLAPGYRSPLVFKPYFLAGGRVHGAWRLTWLSLAPPEADAVAAITQ